MARIVGAHDNVHAVLCGHLHRSVMTGWSGTVVCTIPATAPMLEVNLEGRNATGWIDSPAVVGLHLWREGKGLVSHIVSVDESERYAPFG